MGIIWLRTETVGMRCEHGRERIFCLKTWGISRVPVQLLAAQEGSRCVKVVLTLIFVNRVSVFMIPYLFTSDFLTDV